MCAMPASFQAVELQILSENIKLLIVSYFKHVRMRNQAFF